jgi:hypothetical protein
MLFYLLGVLEIASGVPSFWTKFICEPAYLLVSSRTFTTSSLSMAVPLTPPQAARRLQLAFGLGLDPAPQPGGQRPPDCRTLAP